MLYRPLCATALLLCLLVFALPGQAPEKELAGKYLSTLAVGEQKLRLLIRLEKKGDGYTGTFDSIDQGAKGIPMDTIEVKDGKVKLTWKFGAAFEGQLNEKGDALVGKWKQAGIDLDLTFTRTTEEPKLARPQEPKKPYPYREEDVTFENQPAKVKFAGTLTLPRGDGPFPAAVLLSGSGPQDRDSTIMGHKPFLVLADHLTRQGIAVLRFDDRGVGKSTGGDGVFEATLADNADDALAAVAFLKTRPEIAGKKIGLIGHSEGGVYGPLAASKSSDVAFMIMLAGTGLPGDEILLLQGPAVIRAAGLGEDMVKLQENALKATLDIVRQEKDNAKAKAKVAIAIKAEVEKLPENLRTAIQAQMKLIEAQLTIITTPWFRDFIEHDPRPILRRLKCPSLALIGELDVQVPPRENVRAIQGCFKEGGHRDATVKELAGLNHLFQKAKTGSVAEYASIEETFNPAALGLVSEWIVERFGKK